MSYQIGALLLDVGIDSSSANRAIGRIQNTYSSTLKSVAKGFTTGLAKGTLEAVKGGFSGAVTGGLGGMATGIGAAAVGGLAGAAKGMTDIMANVFEQGIELAVDSRLDVASSVIGGYADTLMKGVMDFGAEQRSVLLADAVLGIGNGTFNADKGTDTEDSTRRMEQMTKNVTEIATQLSFDRASIAGLIEQLARTGVGEDELLGGDTVASRKSSLASQTAYLAEAMALPAYQMDEAVKLMTMARAAYGELSNQTLASGMLGVYANTAQETQRIKFGLQDALPAASGAGVSYEDTLSVVTQLAKLSSFEVAGTLGKTIFNAMANPERLNQQVAGAIDVDYKDQEGGFLGALKERGNTTTELRNISDSIKKALLEGRLGGVAGEEKKTAEYYGGLSDRALEQQVQKYFVKLFGGSDTMIQAVRGITSQTEESEDKLKTSMAQFVSGKLEDDTPVIEAFIAQKQKGVQGSLDLIGSSINNVQVMLGKTLEPAFVTFVSFFTKVANDLTANLGNMTGGLEMINEMFGQLFTDDSFVGNFSDGVQNVVGKVNEIFVGWASSIADYMADAGNVEQIFDNIGDLSVTVANGFTVLFNVMKEFLPVLGDWGDKLGNLGVYLSGKLSVDEVKEEAKRDYEKKQAAGVKGSGMSTETVDVGATKGNIMVANGARVTKLENPEEQLALLNEEQKDLMRQKVRSGEISLDTGRLKYSKTFGIGEYRPDTVGKNSSDEDIDLALSGMRQLLDKDGNYSGIVTSTSRNNYAQNVLHLNEQTGRAGYNVDTEYVKDIIEESNKSLKGIGKGTSDAKDLGTQGLGSLLPNDIAKQIREEERAKIIDPETKEPVAAYASMKPSELAQEIQSKVSTRLNAEQDKYAEKLFGDGVKFDEGSRNLTNVTASSQSLDALSLDINRVKAIMDAAGATGEFSGKGDALDPFVSDSGQLKGSGLDVIRKFVAGIGTEDLATDGSAVGNNTFKQTITNAKGEEVEQTKAFAFNQDQLLTALQLSNGDTAQFIEGLKTASLDTEKGIVESLERFTADRDKLFTSDGDVRSKEIQTFLDNNINNRKDSGDLLGNADKLSDAIVNSLKDSANEEGISREERLARTKIANEFAAEIKRDKQIEPPTGNDATIASTAEDSQKVLRSLTQERLKIEEDINRTKQRTLAIERDIVVQAAAYNGELNGTISQFAGILNQMGSSALTRDTQIRSINTERDNKRFGLNQSIGTKTTMVAEERTNSAGEKFTVAAPTSDQMNYEEIINEQVRREEQYLDKKAALDDKYAKETQQNLLKIVNLVATTAKAAVQNVTSITKSLSQSGSGLGTSFTSQFTSTLDSVKSDSLKLAQAIGALRTIRQNAPGQFTNKDQTTLNSMVAEFEKLPEIVEAGIGDLVNSFREQVERFFNDAIQRQTQRELDVARRAARGNDAQLGLVDIQSQINQFTQKVFESNQQISQLLREKSALEREGAILGVLSEQLGKDGFDTTKLLANQLAQTSVDARIGALQTEEGGIEETLNDTIRLSLLETVIKVGDKLKMITNIFGETGTEAYRLQENIVRLREEHENQTRTLETLDELYALSNEYLGENNDLSQEQINAAKNYVSEMKQLADRLKELSVKEIQEALVGKINRIKTERESNRLRDGAERLDTKADIVDAQGGYGYGSGIESARLRLQADIKEFEAQAADAKARAEEEITNLQNRQNRIRESLKDGTIVDPDARKTAQLEDAVLSQEIATAKENSLREQNKINNNMEKRLELAKKEVTMAGKVAEEVKNVMNNAFDSLYDTLTDGGTSLGDRFRNLGRDILKQLGKVGWNMLTGKIVSMVTGAFTKKDTTKGQGQAGEVNPETGEIDFGTQKPGLFESASSQISQLFSLEPSDVVTELRNQLAKTQAEYELQGAGFGDSIKSQYENFSGVLQGSDLSGLLATASVSGIDGVAISTSATAANTEATVRELEKIHTEFSKLANVVVRSNENYPTESGYIPTVDGRDGSKAQTASTDIKPIERNLLDAIAYSEGTAHMPNKGYNTLYGGGQFSGYDNHPDIVVDAGGYKSSAAGRYQIMNFHKEDMMRKYGDFSPESQDKFALDLAKREPGVQDALDRGDLQGALKKLTSVWEGLGKNEGIQPGGKSFSDIMNWLESRPGGAVQAQTPPFVPTESIARPQEVVKPEPVAPKYKVGATTNFDGYLPPSLDKAGNVMILPGQGDVASERKTLLNPEESAGYELSKSALESHNVAVNNTTNSLTELSGVVASVTEEMKKTADTKRQVENEYKKQGIPIGEQPAETTAPQPVQTGDNLGQIAESAVSIGQDAGSAVTKAANQAKNPKLKKAGHVAMQAMDLAQQTGALPDSTSPTAAAGQQIGGALLSSGNPYAMAAGGVLMLGSALLGSQKKKPNRYNKGVSAVPGNGTTDSVPALLTPGEAVLTRGAVERLGGRDFIEAANFGRMEFLHKSSGGMIPSHYGASSRDLMRLNKGGIVKPTSLGMKKFEQPLRASYTALEAQKYNKMTENQRNIEGFANESDGSGMGAKDGDTFSDNNTMKIEYQSTVINNVEYVTAEQFQVGMEQAVNRSQSGIYKQMRSSPRTRRQLGIR